MTPDPMYRYVATVKRVVDGDTVDLVISLGLRVFTEDRFRLYGINTPERGQPNWAEATAFVINDMPVGSTVIVETKKDTKDKYGRWLAIIYSDETGISINDRLIEAGLAVEYYK